MIRKGGELLLALTVDTTVPLTAGPVLARSHGPGSDTYKTEAGGSFSLYTVELNTLIDTLYTDQLQHTTDNTADLQRYTDT